MKDPGWITVDIVRAVAKTSGQIIDWAEEIEKGIVAAIQEEREECAKIVEGNRFKEPGEVADLIRARGWKRLNNRNKSEEERNDA